MCIKVCFRIAIRLLSTPVLELVDSVEGFDSLWIWNSCPTLLLRVFVVDSSTKVEPSSVLIALVCFFVVVAASRATEAFHSGWQCDGIDRSLVPAALLHLSTFLCEKRRYWALYDLAIRTVRRSINSLSAIPSVRIARSDRYDSPRRIVIVISLFGNGLWLFKRCVLHEIFKDFRTVFGRGKIILRAICCRRILGWDGWLLNCSRIILIADKYVALAFFTILSCGTLLLRLLWLLCESLLYRFFVVSVKKASEVRHIVKVFRSVSHCTLWLLKME